MSKEEVKSTVPAGREDSHKGNYPERPRSSNRSNYKAGGRGWVRGRGRGSRGRGHARPYSSGAKDYYAKPSSVDGRDKFKGQSSNDKGSTEHHQGGEKTTHQSQDRMEHKKGVDQSKERFENYNEKQLVDECKEGRRQKLQVSQRLKEEKTVTLDKELTNLERTKKWHQKLGKPTEKSENTRSLESKENVNQVDKATSDTATKNSVVQKNRSTVDKDVLKQTDDKVLHPPEGKVGDVSASKSAERNKKSKTEGETCDSQPKPSWKRTSKITKENSDEDRGIGVGSQSRHSVNGREVRYENQNGQRPYRNQWRQGQINQSKDSFQSRRGGRDYHERSKGKSHTDSRKEVLGNEDRSSVKDKTESHQRTSGEKPRKRTPPGFEMVKDDTKDLGQRSVKPPPGFENVKL